MKKAEGKGFSSFALGFMSYLIMFVTENAL